MTQFDAVGAAPKNAGISNGREIGAYAIAQAIKIVLTYLVSFSGLLSPLYLAAYKSGGAVGTVPITLGVNIVWGTAALLLFLALRSALGGVPTMIAGPGGEAAFTSRSGEIGAFVVAYLLVLVVVLVLNGMFLAPLYASLARGGQSQIVLAIGFSIALVNVAIVYAIFIGLRAAFCRPTQTIP